ncbi:MAG TPA: endo-1,4-beta-xylanase [Tepidisphaeraceae bacterium]|jgi:GH35 family endo-1,4-beta-xylanase|nr:endo-1,4-beta-xylanase [Tepidisphaeraceae bacterium]
MQLSFACLLAAIGVFAVAANLTVAAPPPPVASLDEALTSKAPMNLLPDDLPKEMTFQDRAESTPSPTAAWSTSQGSAPVLRVESFNRPKWTDHVSVRWANRMPIKRGDVMLARFQVRAEYARQESGEALFELAVLQRTPEYTPHIVLPLTAGPDWALIEVPFSAARDADAGQCEIQLRFGTIPQAVEIASFSVLNFGDRATIAELPQTRFTYKGREEGAAWRKEALARIERIRTAPLDIRVIDATGKPVPDAAVAVRLVRPAFIFGSEVSAGTIVEDSPDAERYRQTALEMFDTLVIGNDMKWHKWSGSAAVRAMSLKATGWIESQGLRMRGHCLVWPGDRFAPKRIAAMPAPRAEMSPLIKEHIRDIMTATRGRIVGWDVINEMVHERDFFKYVPESEAAEWFKVARETDPRAKLFINDYGMLNSRKSPDTIAKYVDIVQRLLAAGAPIDGMGIQGHVGRQVRNPEDVLTDLDLLAVPGLELQITEFEINTTDESLQADYTRDFLIALYSHPAVTGFTKWGFWESRHWKPDGAMYRKDWSEKPNAAVWRDLVRNQWRTSADVTTDAQGKAQTRGHLGDYEFTVTWGERTARQMRTLTSNGTSLTIQFP